MIYLRYKFVEREKEKHKKAIEFQHCMKSFGFRYHESNKCNKQTNP